MHSLLEQLKMQKKDSIVSRQFSQAILGHLFWTCRPYHSPYFNTILIIRIREPEGACSLGKALLLLTDSATEKGTLCMFGSLDIFCLIKGTMCHGHVRDHPSEQTVTFFKRQRETGVGKPPSVHCLRKDLSLLLASIWPKDVGWAICWHTQSYTKSLLFPFLLRQSHVSLGLGLSNKPLAEATGKAGVDIHDWSLRTSVSSVPARLALKGPPFHEVAWIRPWVFDWILPKWSLYLHCPGKTLILG